MRDTIKAIIATICTIILAPFIVVCVFFILMVFMLVQAFKKGKSRGQQHLEENLTNPGDCWDRCTARYTTSVYGIASSCILFPLILIISLIASIATLYVVSPTVSAACYTRFTGAEDNPAAGELHGFFLTIESMLHSLSCSNPRFSSEVTRNIMNSTRLTGSTPRHTEQEVEEQQIMEQIAIENVPTSPAVLEAVTLEHLATETAVT